MSRWFRFYTEVVDDPKVQRLTAEMFRTWVNLLCVASKNDGVIARCDVAFVLRCGDDMAKVVIEFLIEANLLEDRGDILVPHNWDTRQYKSDNSDPTAPSRQKRFRDNKRNGDRNATVTDTVTVTATRADTEQNRTEQKEGASAPPTPVLKKDRKRATAFPEGLLLNYQPALDAGLTNPEAEREWQRFQNYAAEKGRTAVDWAAAWRNWCLKAADFLGRQPAAKLSAVEPTGFYAAFGSKQLDAWAEYGRSKGKSYPRDKTGGWRFPTEYPPGYKSEAA